MTHSQTAGIVLLLGALSASSASAQDTAAPYQLSVIQEHVLRDSRGVLVFGPDSVEFKTPATKDARQWPYRDIKQLQIRSTTRLDILTYEDQGGLKMGADRTVEFKVSEGEVTPELVTFLFERTTRPIVTAVLPVQREEPSFRSNVKHQRQGKGSEGTLAVYRSGVAYATDRGGASRYWPLSDLYSVLRLDRFRLEVVAYEGGSGETRPYVFELKTEMPEGAFRALWEGVNGTRHRPY